MYLPTGTNPECCTPVNCKIHKTHKWNPMILYSHWFADHAQKELAVQMLIGSRKTLAHHSTRQKYLRESLLGHFLNRWYVLRLWQMRAVSHNAKSQCFKVKFKKSLGLKVNRKMWNQWLIYGVCVPQVTVWRLTLRRGHTRRVWMFWSTTLSPCAPSLGWCWSRPTSRRWPRVSNLCQCLPAPAVRLLIIIITV